MYILRFNFKKYNWKSKKCLIKKNHLLHKYVEAMEIVLIFHTLKILFHKCDHFCCFGIGSVWLFIKKSTNNVSEN